MPEWGDALPGGLDIWQPGDWGDGLPLGPGGLANVVSASMANCNTIRLVYDSAMHRSDPTAANDVLNPSNYSISGPTVINVQSISVYQASPTVVDIIIDAPGVHGIVDGGAYTITVSNVTSENNLALGTDNANFFGVTCQASNYIAEILVGNTVIWSSENELQEQDLSIDVSQYTGIENLRFRIRGLS